MNSDKFMLFYWYGLDVNTGMHCIECDKFEEEKLPVMMGHVHEQFAKAFLRLTPNHNCTSIGQKITMGLITGSYGRLHAKRAFPLNSHC